MPTDEFDDSAMHRPQGEGSAPDQSHEASTAEFIDEPRTMRFSGVPAHEVEQGDVDGRGLNAEDVATIDALRDGTALLIVLRGPNTGARFLLDDAEVSSGRHPDSDIFLDDVTVSRKHAVFNRTADGYTVSDAGSLNGTYVNRQRIDEAALQTGDEVQIGKFRLVYYAA